MKAAKGLPGRGTRIYRTLKELFREVDAGSRPESGLEVPGYNGELFKHDAIIDVIDLPDDLARKTYEAHGPSGEVRKIEGVWGLHVFDFWTELNEHLLGHVFEESLSDLKELEAADPVELSEKLKERKKRGIYYTSSLLSDFLASSALRAYLAEKASLSPGGNEGLKEQINHRMSVLGEMRIMDPACGSGAFLVSSYRGMLAELWRLQEAQRSLSKEGRETLELWEHSKTLDRASVLRDSLFGIDLLPQAVEIAKLALWLHSARKDEKIADLSSNLLAADSLRPSNLFSAFAPGEGCFDIVIGNPPWGADVDAAAWPELQEWAGDLEISDFDTWELFLLLGIRALQDGGRLAFVLPDSFFYPEKHRTRQLLLDHGRIEKVLNLGPGWFGADVRMGTALIQFRRGDPTNEMDFIQGTLLAGGLRKEAIKGEIPLSQIEAQRSREIAAARVLASPKREIEVFRGRRDDKIIEQIRGASVRLESLCDVARGEEINKAGWLWVCPSCMSPTVPGRKKKGGEYEDKLCPSCDHTLTESSVQDVHLVSKKQGNGTWVTYVDGDDITDRYQGIHPRKWFRTDLPGWNSKGAGTYAGPKILIRQAGVGLVAALDRGDAWCPQSVYVYRLKPDFLKEGWRHEFLLGALLSRTMSYYVFKRWAEVDPDKAHPKVTHTRLKELPIPELDLSDKAQQRIHDEIVAAVDALLKSPAPNDSVEDRRVEVLLREAWGITPDDGAYINGEFFDLPPGQVVSSLFPNGVPRYRADAEVAA